MRWLDGITGSMDMNLSELRELLMDNDVLVAFVQHLDSSIGGGISGLF